jgi:uncharacterized membrane protein
MDHVFSIKIYLNIKFLINRIIKRARLTAILLVIFGAVVVVSGLSPSVNDCLYILS